MVEGVEEEAKSKRLSVMGRIGSYGLRRKPADLPQVRQRKAVATFNYDPEGI